LRVPIYVLNMRGQPLMPTTQRKGKNLLHEGKAHVVQRCPFTIQLNYATGETKQPIKLEWTSDLRTSDLVPRPIS
jgi:hypothetical protein